MILDTLDNVNFRLLVRAHNGNLERATAAWHHICALGGFGSVPVTYEGGVDVKGIRTSRDEYDHRGNTTIERGDHLDFDAIVDQHFMKLQVPLPVPVPPREDDIKRIEDIAAGDKPK
jgi:hypothetical protein